jgi:hypothetical protein
MVFKDKHQNNMYMYYSRYVEDDNKSISYRSLGVSHADTSLKKRHLVLARRT